ncbi:hypothetical protein AB0A73_22145 [Glycomyces sp. NPDC047369]
MTDLINQVQFPHADRMAVTICETGWEAVLEALPLLDGYLAAELTAAADRLHLADRVANATLGPYRLTLAIVDWLPEAKTRQFTEADVAVATCGYLHPSRVDLLIEPLRQAIEERHEARNALADLLALARTTIEDTA